MTLDDVEKMAREIDDHQRELAKFAAETGNYLHTFNEHHLARALLAVMPVVRAAERWRVCDETHPSLCNGHQDLADTVDQMRAALEEKP